MSDHPKTVGAQMYKSKPKDSPKPHEAEPTERQKVLHFNPWLLPSPRSPLSILAEELFDSIEQHPQAASGRKPRADAMLRRKDALRCLVANLALFELHHPAYTSLAVPFRKTKKTRYDRAGISKDVLRGLVDALQKAGLVNRAESEFRKLRTCLNPSTALSERLWDLGLNRDSIERAKGSEVIELWVKPRGRFNRELAEFKDTKQTNRIRSEVLTLNDFMRDADITFDSRAMPVPHIVRIFSDRFEWHGRFYAWWQNIKQKDRYRLRISGERVVDLDFSSMFIQLAYWKVGCQMPEGDPYILPELNKPEYRKAVKRLFNSLFFRQEGHPALKLLKGLKGNLPQGFTMADFVRNVKEDHPHLAPLINTEIGYELFKAESDILIAALLELSQRGIVGLGMHDGMMVAESVKLEAMDAMEKAGLAVTGLKLNIVEKPISYPD